MKKFLCVLVTLSLLALATACGSSESVQAIEETEDKVVVGFSQLGAESDWRCANTESMKAAFTEDNGYELIFDDAQQKRENQIKAIRNFIQQEVDYIVLAPVTETGWDTVLTEVKEAGIPVIVVDRMVDVADESLYTCFVGSDFELEGKKAAAWLHEYTKEKGIAPEDVHIVNIQGTIGATAQIGRTKGLSEAVEEYGWDLMAEVSGEYTKAKGREVMEEFLKTYSNINVVYCENDNEAFGAIEAIEAAGKKVGGNIAGGEIMVMSFDAVSEAMGYALEGKITCVTECNPLHGPRVKGIIETLEAGGVPEKMSYASEGIFASDDTVKKITVEGTGYDVTVVTQELLRNSAY